MFKPGKKLSLTFILPVLLVLGVLFGLGGFIINIPDYFDQLSTKVTYPSSYEFKIYDSLLRKYVKNGLVDYRSIKHDPDLERAYRQIKSIDPSKLQGKLEQLCFWVNTYNFLTIKCIADLYPIERLRQESALKHFMVGGKLYSLNQIRQEVFPELIYTSDWRAIFLICSGNISSPFIADHAYSASRVGDEFEQATKNFVLSPANYGWDDKQRIFSISPFYKRNVTFIDRVYASPFEMVNSMLPAEKKVNLEDCFRNYAMAYDWRINDTAWLKELDNKSAKSVNSSDSAASASKKDSQ